MRISEIERPEIVIETTDFFTTILIYITAAFASITMIVAAIAMRHKETGNC